MKAQKKSISFEKFEKQSLTKDKMKKTIKGGTSNPITDVIMDSLVLGPEVDGKVRVGMV